MKARAVEAMQGTSNGTATPTDMDAELHDKQADTTTAPFSSTPGEEETSPSQHVLLTGYQQHLH